MFSQTGVGINVANCDVCPGKVPSSTPCCDLFAQLCPPAHPISMLKRAASSQLATFIPFKTPPLVDVAAPSLNIEIWGRVGGYLNRCSNTRVATGKLYSDTSLFFMSSSLLQSYCLSSSSLWLLSMIMLPSLYRDRADVVTSR